MTGLFLLYGIITGMLAVLVTVYTGTAYMLYRYYRNHGMTRKQAFLSMWRMYGE